MPLIRLVEVFNNPSNFKNITVNGWVRTFRANKFVALNDGSTVNNLQCVIDFEKTNEKILKKIASGVALKVKGELVKSLGKGQDYELLVDTIKIIGESDPELYPIQPKKHSFEFLREKAHLRIRTSTMSCIMRIRSVLAFAIHEFFRKESFFYVNTPIITGSDAEGAGEMFRVTTLDPKNRKLLKVSIPDGFAIETENVISDLMGKDPRSRYKAITEWMSVVDSIDV